MNYMPTFSMINQGYLPALPVSTRQSIITQKAESSFNEADFVLSMLEYRCYLRSKHADAFVLFQEILSKIEQINRCCAVAYDRKNFLEDEEKKITDCISSLKTLAPPGVIAPVIVKNIVSRLQYLIDKESPLTIEQKLDSFMIEKKSDNTLCFKNWDSFLCVEKKLQNQCLINTGEFGTITPDEYRVKIKNYQEMLRVKKILSDYQQKLQQSSANQFFYNKHATVEKMNIINAALNGLNNNASIEECYVYLDERKTSLSQRRDTWLMALIKQCLSLGLINLYRLAKPYAGYGATDGMNHCFFKIEEIHDTNTRRCDRKSIVQ